MPRKAEKDDDFEIEEPEDEFQDFHSPDAYTFEAEDGDEVSLDSADLDDYPEEFTKELEDAAKEAALEEKRKKEAELKKQGKLPVKAKAGKQTKVVKKKTAVKASKPVKKKTIKKTVEPVSEVKPKVKKTKVKEIKKEEPKITEQLETNIKVNVKEETEIKNNNKEQKKKKEENIGIIDFISNKEIAIAGFVFLVLIVIFITFMIGASSPQNTEANEISGINEIQENAVNETISEPVAENIPAKEIKNEENPHVRIVRGSGL